MYKLFIFSQGFSLTCLKNSQNNYMADIGALNYEYLLRSIYQVGRYGRKGVDADEYRNLEQAESLFRTASLNFDQQLPNNHTESKDELEFAYRTECANIASYVHKALKVAIGKFANKFSATEINQLVILAGRLDFVSCEKSTIDAVIKEAQDILVSHMIYPK